MPAPDRVVPATPAAAVAAATPPAQQTSIDHYQQSDATVRFRRWTGYGSTAYLRGQEAGFPIGEARALERRGVADVVFVRDSFVTK